MSAEAPETAAVRRRRADRASAVGVVVAALALLGVATLLGAATLDGGRAVGPPVAAAAGRLGADAAGACGRWTLLAGVGQARGPEVSLFTDGVARFAPCAGGGADLALRGTSARGVAAYAVVEDADGIRFAGFVDEPIELRVRGEVRLHFANDLATADEDRNLHAAVR
jgi:hypothetical protein